LPYGLLLPVARVATPAAALEVRKFLDVVGIRSTTAPCQDGQRTAPRPQWRLVVLVFAKDVTRARRLVDQWTLPARTP
jgi:hypothetical protein